MGKKKENRAKSKTPLKVDVKYLCIKEKFVGKLPPLCLGSIVTLCFRGSD
jgi:hypothetical protein